MALTLGSLCTGIAGLDLAVQELTGAKLTWMAEINKDASKVLAERFPEVPNLGDLKDLTTNTPPAVDVLTAGYPCQPFSWAGHRKGANDERHLWPYIREIIGHIRPRYVFMENVIGHLNLGFGEVVGQLTEMGYRVSWGTLRAADVGAPHNRERLFIFATTVTDADSFGFKTTGVWKAVPTEVSSIDFSEGVLPRWESLTRRAPSFTNPKGEFSPRYAEWMMGLPDGWVCDVIESENKQIECIGNAVCPQQAQAAFELLTEGIRNEAV